MLMEDMSNPRETVREEKEVEEIFDYAAPDAGGPGTAKIHQDL
jgi:hypothetical protein